MMSSLGVTLRNIVFLNPRYFNGDLAPLRVKSGLFAGHISKDNCLSFQKIPKDLLFDPCKPEISRDQNRDFSWFSSKKNTHFVYRIPGINRMDIDILTSHTIGLDLIICHKIGEKILVSTDDVIMTSSIGAVFAKMLYFSGFYYF